MGDQRRGHGDRRVGDRRTDLTPQPGRVLAFPPEGEGADVTGVATDQTVVRRPVPTLVAAVVVFGGAPIWDVSCALPTARGALETATRPSSGTRAVGASPGLACVLQAGGEAVFAAVGVS